MRQVPKDLRTMAIYVSYPRRHLHSPHPSGIPFLHWPQTTSDIFSRVTSGQQSPAKLVLRSHLCPVISPNLLQLPPLGKGKKMGVLAAR